MALRPAVDMYTLDPVRVSQPDAILCEVLQLAYLAVAIRYIVSARCTRYDLDWGLDRIKIYFSAGGMQSNKLGKAPVIWPTVDKKCSELLNRR